MILARLSEEQILDARISVYGGPASKLPPGDGAGSLIAGASPASQEDWGSRELIQSKVISPLPEKGLAPPLERWRLCMYLVQTIADVIFLVCVFAIAKVQYLGDTRMPGVNLSAALMVPLYLTIALHNGTYSLASLLSWKTAITRAGSALLISAVLLNFFAFFAKMNEEFSRAVFAIGMIGTMALLLASRVIVERLIKRLWGPSARNCLVIEAGGPQLGLQHAYRINAADHGLLPAMDNPDSLDRLAHYLCNMDEIIVSCRDEDRAKWAEVLKGSGIRGEIVSDFAREIGAVGLVKRERANLTTFLVSLGPLGVRARLIKRLFDVTISATSLLALSPVFVAIAVAIILEDRGPILFRQRRMGRGNRFFIIYKFRSMRVAGTDADGARSVVRGDDRVTRVGRLLRKTSLDELPQFLNVLRGDMSMVGPRPHALGSRAGKKMFWQVDSRYWHRHSLRPGMTGLAQIRGHRGATDHEDDLSARLQSDLEYLQGWTILRDVKILIATLGVLLHHRAY